MQVLFLCILWILLFYVHNIILPDAMFARMTYIVQQTTWTMAHSCSLCALTRTILFSIFFCSTQERICAPALLHVRCLYNHPACAPAFTDKLSVDHELEATCQQLFSKIYTA